MHLPPDSFQELGLKPSWLTDEKIANTHEQDLCKFKPDKNSSLEGGSWHKVPPLDEEHW